MAKPARVYKWLLPPKLPDGGRVGVKSHGSFKKLPNIGVP